MAKIYEFHWKGVNRFGQTMRGKQLAETAVHVEQRLLDQGVTRLSIQRNFVLNTAPKNEQITQSLNQLSLLLNASIPLKQSLVILLENCTHIALYRWLHQIILQLENGFSLSTGLMQGENYLTPQEIQLIQIGEKSGRLAIILNGIIENRLKYEKLNKKIKKILFYPLMILVISITLSILLLLFIVPTFAELYQNKQASLPFLTHLLFKLSEILRYFAEFIPLVLGLTGLGLFLLRKQKIFPRCFYRFLGHIPIFKTIIRNNRLIFFCRYAGLMLNAHLRLDTVLHSFINKHNDDPHLSQAMQLALERLKQGYQLNESLNPKIFPIELLQMIAIGEKSAELATMLLHISDMYQQKLDYQIDLLSQLLEPMLMLIMGVIVGTILIGLYLPIFDMGAMIG